MSIASLSREAWQFRDFIVASVKREFVSRYQGTQLGIFWPIAHSLALVVIYTLVFSEIMRPRLAGHEGRFAYSIYLTAGLIIWTLFSDLLARLVGIFVQNGGLMKKVSIPKIAFPVIATTSALIHFTIILVIFVMFLVIAGRFPGLPLLGLIPVLAVTVLFQPMAVTATAPTIVSNEKIPRIPKMIRSTETIARPVRSSSKPS